MSLTTIAYCLGGRALYPTIGAAIAAGLPWLTVQRHQTRVTGVLPAMLHLKVPRVSYKGLVKRLLQINVRLHPRKKRR